MAEPNAPAVAVTAQDRQLNLRYLQGEALGSLYLATHIFGLALLAMAIQFEESWPAGYLGLLLQVVLYPAHRVFLRNYLVRAWLLVALWWGSALVGALLLPQAPFLLALPVGLAAFFIGTPAGLLTGLGASAVVAWSVRGGGAPADGALAALMIWGVFLLIRLGLRPMEGAVHWSWTNYELARRQVEQARDTQARLKQTVKDLAEASAQMARLNQLLGAARRAAEEAERAKAEFVANVSHELRTPLNMIIGFGEMILQAPRAYGRISPALRADLSVILRNSQHLSSLIDDVLDLSQIEAGQIALSRERTLLCDLVEAAVQAMRPLFETKGLYLTVEVPAEIGVFCDRTRIREVLLNLLSNAGRFTDQGGVTVRARIEGSEVVVSVADTGPGIAPEEQGKLFKPFQQVDGSLRRRCGGTGLGLAISKHFVELHNGRMWLESQAGQGTTIHFTLPAEPLPPASAFRRWLNPEWEWRERPSRPALPAPVVRPRLVVVERGNILQRMLSRYLGDVEVAAVASLEEAGKELSRVPAEALLVSDLAVGETLERVRQSAILPYGTPALVCALPGEQEAAQSLGVEGYLVKPISRDVLLAALERLGVRRGTILIVDDEAEAVRLFWRMLMASGRDYRVLTAASGQQALTILRSERPDAVLLDLVMPAMDGFQLLATRDEEPVWRDVPVVVMSARDPAGHPIATSAIGITRHGGLSVPQVLACLRALRTRPESQGDSLHA